MTEWQLHNSSSYLVVIPATEGPYGLVRNRMIGVNNDTVVGWAAPHLVSD